MRTHNMIIGPALFRAIVEQRAGYLTTFVACSNSYVDGSPWRWQHWVRLDLTSRVTVDAGPSPAGNPGPYLQVPHSDTDTWHRVYPRVRLGDRLIVRPRPPGETHPVKLEVLAVTVERATVHLWLWRYEYRLDERGRPKGEAEQCG